MRVKGSIPVLWHHVVNMLDCIILSWRILSATIAKLTGPRDSTILAKHSWDALYPIVTAS